MIPQLAGESSIFNLCHPEVLVHLSLVPDGGESDCRGNRLAAFLALQITSQERDTCGQDEGDLEGYNCMTVMWLIMGINGY